MEQLDRPIARKLAPLAVAGRIAGPQHGVVARWQLTRAGLTRDQIDHLVGRGSLLPLYRAVYAVGHRPVSPRSREMAVALLARGPVGGQSALALWAMTRPWHGPVHALGTHSWSGPGFVIHRTRHLPHGDLTTNWGIPVTTPLRTLLDVSRTLSLDALDAALAEALVRKLVRLEDVQARATGNLAKLARTAAPTRSRLERAFRKLLQEHGLPQPTSNGFVCGHEVDLHWPELKLIVEIDGYGTHDHRRAFEADRLRDQRLLAAGWRVARVTEWQMSELRAETAGRFTALLQPAA